jgi:hypothetical protein
MSQAFDRAMKMLRMGKWFDRMNFHVHLSILIGAGSSDAPELLKSADGHQHLITEYQC